MASPDGIPSVPPDELDKDQVLAGYLGGLLQDGIDTRCLDFPVSISVCMGRELSSIAPRTRADRLFDIDLGFSADSKADYRQRLALDTLLEEQAFARVIVLGGAGSGKSLLAHQIVYSAADKCIRQMASPDDVMNVPPVPLLVPILDMLRLGATTLSKYIDGMFDCEPSLLL